MPRFRVIVKEIYWKEYLVEHPRAVDAASAMRLVDDGVGTFIDSWPADRLPMSEWNAAPYEDELDEEDEDMEEDEEPVEVPTRFVRTTRTPVTEEEVEDVDFGDNTKS